MFLSDDEERRDDENKEEDDDPYECIVRTLTPEQFQWVPYPCASFTFQETNRELYCLAHEMKVSRLSSACFTPAFFLLLDFGLFVSVMEDRPRISARKASLRPIRRFYVVPGTEQNNTVYRRVEMLTSSSSSCVRRASVTAEDLLGSF